MDRIAILLAVFGLPVGAALRWRSSVRVRRWSVCALGVTWIVCGFFGLRHAVQRGDRSVGRSRTEVVEYRVAYVDGLLAAQDGFNNWAEVMFVISGCLGVLAVLPVRNDVKVVVDRHGE